MLKKGFIFKVSSRVVEKLGLVCFLEQRDFDYPGIDNLMNGERFQISGTRRDGSTTWRMPSSIGSTPRTRNAWQAALPQSGISLTLLSWRGSGYRPNLPLFGLSTSASAEHGAALWAWRCKTVLVSVLATNFSYSVFPYDSFSLSHSFLLIVFFLSLLHCQHLLQHARTSFLYPTCTHTRARSCTHSHTFRISHLWKKNYDRIDKNQNQNLKKTFKISLYTTWRFFVLTTYGRDVDG